MAFANSSAEDLLERTKTVISEGGMRAENTALVLIGFQNDYFSEAGALHGFLEEPGRAKKVLKRTVSLIRVLEPTRTSIISTPIVFTADYRELSEPVGILASIKEHGAFRGDRTGGQTVPELQAFGDRILEVPGKRGLNAFSNTALEERLREKGVKNVVVAGVVTSICVDSTARSAFERGFSVSVLSDCTAGRTALEQDFYCSSIFPLYAQVITSSEMADRLRMSKTEIC